MSDLRVGNKFKIVKKCGNGAFGDIYDGKNINNGDRVAIKLEKVDCKFP